MNILVIGGTGQVGSLLLKQLAARGGDWRGVEARTAEQMPPWGARDIALMFRGVEETGMLGRPGAVERLSALLGRPPRSYQSFATEQCAQWLGSEV